MLLINGFLEIWADHRRPVGRGCDIRFVCFGYFDYFVYRPERRAVQW